jgi:hypothetical protein
MAWMPVAEAAARLGVSERTIWRRIKSDSIQSRSEGGRTLVAYEDPAGETVRQLSHVAAAQLSMRKLDADTFGEAVGALGEFRNAFEREMARKRTALRVVGSLAAVLLIALAAGAYWHVDRLHQLRGDHSAALAEVAQHSTVQRGEDLAELARAEGMVSAQTQELEHLREVTDAHRDQVAALEASRDALQCTIEERLDELTQEVVARETGAVTHAGERDQLAKTITELREALHRKDLVRLASQQQAERITAALRRHAARNAGLVEGLRLHAELQQKALVRMQSELTDLRTVLASQPDARDAMRELTLRQTMRSSILGPAAADDAPVDISQSDWPQRAAGWGRDALAWLARLPERMPTGDDDALARAE